MKIAFITPTSQQVIGFRAALIAALQEKGHKVVTISFDDNFRAEIEKRDIEHYSVGGSNRSLDPFKILSLKGKIKKVLDRIKPDIVFTFMLKPNIFGTRAAKAAKVKTVFSMVEGGGDVFINGGIKWKLIRSVVCKMYRKSFKIPDKVFFLNNDDINEFVERKLVKREKCDIVHGIGVDTERFCPSPVENRRTFLMIARMLKTKGVTEYCRAARIVRQKYPDAVFNYLGGEGNVKLDDIREYVDDGSVNYLGTTNDVRPYINECTALVLPSYREGLPVAVLEAMASARAVVATDVNGCRDAVEDGKNGLLAAPRNTEDLAEKIVWCIEHPEQTEQFGIIGRQIAEDKFDAKKINELLLEFIDKQEANK